MPSWAIIFLILVGAPPALFLAKLTYVVCLGGSLFVTRGALFVATASTRIEAFLAAVPMKPGEFFVDLGCGDGRVLRAVRKHYGVKALGYEINPLAFGAARIRSRGTKGVRVRWSNFWNEDLSHVDVVFCYLFPDVMGPLAAKLEEELREGVRVVSCNFPIPGWHPQRVVRPLAARHSDPIFVYRFPDCRQCRQTARPA